MFSYCFNRRLFFKTSVTCCLVMAGSKLVSISDDVEAIHSFQLGHLAGLVYPDQHFASEWYYEICKACVYEDLRSVLQLKIFDDFDNSRIEFIGPYLVSDTEVNIFKTQEALNGSESVKEISKA